MAFFFTFLSVALATFPNDAPFVGVGPCPVIDVGSSKLGASVIGKAALADSTGTGALPNTAVVITNNGLVTRDDNTENGRVRARCFDQVVSYGSGTFLLRGQGLYSVPAPGATLTSTVWTQLTTAGLVDYADPGVSSLVTYSDFFVDSKTCSSPPCACCSAQINVDVTVQAQPTPSVAPVVKFWNTGSFAQFPGNVENPGICDSCVSPFAPLCSVPDVLRGSGSILGERLSTSRVIPLTALLTESAFFVQEYSAGPMQKALRAQGACIIDAIVVSGDPNPVNLPDGTVLPPTAVWQLRFGKRATPVQTNTLFCLLAEVMLDPVYTDPTTGDSVGGTKQIGVRIFSSAPLGVFDPVTIGTTTYTPANCPASAEASSSIFVNEFLDFQYYMNPVVPTPLPSATPSPSALPRPTPSPRIESRPGDLECADMTSQLPEWLVGTGYSRGDVIPGSGTVLQNGDPRMLQDIIFTITQSKDVSAAVYIAYNRTGSIARYCLTSWYQWAGVITTNEGQPFAYPRPLYILESVSSRNATQSEFLPLKTNYPTAVTYPRYQYNITSVRTRRTCFVVEPPVVPGGSLRYMQFDDPVYGYSDNGGCAVHFPTEFLRRVEFDPGTGNGRVVTNWRDGSIPPKTACPGPDIGLLPWYLRGSGILGVKNGGLIPDPKSIKDSFFDVNGAASSPLVPATGYFVRGGANVVQDRAPVRFDIWGNTVWWWSPGTPRQDALCVLSATPYFGVLPSWAPGATEQRVRFRDIWQVTLTQLYDSYYIGGVDTTYSPAQAFDPNTVACKTNPNSAACQSSLSTCALLQRNQNDFVWTFNLEPPAGSVSSYPYGLVPIPFSTAADTTNCNGKWTAKCAAVTFPSRVCPAIDMGEAELNPTPFPASPTPVAPITQLSVSGFYLQAEEGMGKVRDYAARPTGPDITSGRYDARFARPSGSVTPTMDPIDQNWWNNNLAPYNGKDGLYVDPRLSPTVDPAAFTAAASPTGSATGSPTPTATLTQTPSAYPNPFAKTASPTVSFTSTTSAKPTPDPLILTGQNGLPLCPRPPSNNDPRITEQVPVRYRGSANLIKGDLLGTDTPLQISVTEQAVYITSYTVGMGTYVTTYCVSGFTEPGDIFGADWAHVYVLLRAPGNASAVPPVAPVASFVCLGLYYDNSPKINSPAKLLYYSPFFADADDCNNPALFPPSRLESYMVVDNSTGWVPNAIRPYACDVADPSKTTNNLVVGFGPAADTAPDAGSVCAQLPAGVPNYCAAALTSRVCGFTLRSRYCSRFGGAWLIESCVVSVTDRVLTVQGVDGKDVSANELGLMPEIQLFTPVMDLTWTGPPNAPFPSPSAQPWPQPTAYPFKDGKDAASVKAAAESCAWYRIDQGKIFSNPYSLLELSSNDGGCPNGADWADAVGHPGTSVRVVAYAYSAPFAQRVSPAAVPASNAGAVAAGILIPLILIGLGYFAWKKMGSPPLALPPALAALFGGRRAAPSKASAKKGEKKKTAWESASNRDRESSIVVAENPARKAISNRDAIGEEDPEGGGVNVVMPGEDAIAADIDAAVEGATSLSRADDAGGGADEAVSVAVPEQLGMVQSTRVVVTNPFAMASEGGASGEALEKKLLPKPPRPVSLKIPSSPARVPSEPGVEGGEGGTLNI